MPGSPPTSSTEPRTKPPPVTRSNSAMPEGRRGASCASPASGSSANGRPLRGGRPGPAPVLLPVRAIRGQPHHDVGDPRLAPELHRKPHHPVGADAGAVAAGQPEGDIGVAK